MIFYLSLFFHKENKVRYENNVVNWRELKKTKKEEEEENILKPRRIDWYEANIHTVYGMWRYGYGDSLSYPNMITTNLFHKLIQTKYLFFSCDGYILGLTGYDRVNLSPHWIPFPFNSKFLQYKTNYNPFHY